MRLTFSEIEIICNVVREVFGESASVKLFGSRLNDEAKGGDIDLLIEVPCVVEEPAVLIARSSSRISRKLESRNVDVVLKAPNLLILTIHEIASKTEVILSCLK